MSEIIQFDPALRQLLLQKTGNLSGTVPSEEIGVEEIPVVAKLADPSVVVASLTVVSRFGQVVTGRVPLNRIVEVRQNRNIISLKASENHEPDLAFSVPDIHASPEILREQTGLETVTGRGVVIGIADWGCDFAHANFRDEYGGTRLLYLWDQRGGLQPESPGPFCYGREFSRDRINLALAEADPYVALDYDPADADPKGIGTHGTHVMDIAAGNGRAPGASPGVAPGGTLIFVHLKGDDTRPGDTLGDSVRLLEAIRYIVDRAGNQPVVINMSLGRTVGPHDGKTLLEQGLDTLLEERPGCAIVMSTGNYFGTDMHSSGQIKVGEYTDLRWRVTPRNDEIAKMDVWYSGADTFTVEVIDPTGKSLARVALGDNSVIRDGERIIVSIYHRRHDPNNGDNHCVIFLWADAMLGTWITRLHGETVTNGQYHAWIERDDPAFQSRFTPECAVQTSTTNTICNGFETIAVGAYDAREATHPLVPVSSEGPTRDDRAKPDISAPGAGIRAARSSNPQVGYREMDGLTTKSGTSMAAPHVAGTIALMFETAGKYRLTVEETRAILFKTARSSPPYNEFEHLRYGAGRVDAAAAVKEVRARRESKAAPNTLFSTKGAPVAALTSSEIEESYREDYAVVSDEEDSDDDGELHDFDWADWDDQALRKRLAVILPRLLVQFGESELRRTDQYGVPIYDKSQLLVFGPTGRPYSLTAGRFNYHAANFVYNTAYQLGYDVPVYPPDSDSASKGKSYHSTTATFAALAGTSRAEDREYFSRFFEVVAWPGQSGPLAIREGDLLLRGSEPGAVFGHIAIIADPILHSMLDSIFTSRDARGGKGVQCIDAGVSINTLHDRFGRVLTDEHGKVLDSRMILRFKERVIDIPRIIEQMDHSVSYRQVLERANRSSDRGGWPEISEISPRRHVGNFLNEGYAPNRVHPCLSGSLSQRPAESLATSLLAEQTPQEIPTRCEIIIQTQDAGGTQTLPLREAWVYWREGENLTVLRTDETGHLFSANAGAVRTHAWGYTTRFFMNTGKQVQLYFSRGALPIPDSLLNSHLDIFLQRTVTLPHSQSDQATVTITLPNILIQFTKPADLSLWPLLWELPSDAYHTDGLNQGAALWNRNSLTVPEMGPAPPPPVAVRPKERGLALEGTIDARATGVRVQVLDSRGNAVQLRQHATATTNITEIRATLDSASGNTKPFRTAIYFADAAATFGLVQVLVLSDGITPPIMGAFTCHLVGFQIVLINDYSVNINGQSRGPILTESNESIVIDFLASPQNTLGGISNQTRARRMVTYQMANRSRPLSNSNPTPVLKPEMPLWMAEFQIIGMNRSQLESLLVYRNHLIPGNPTDLRFDLRWKLTLSWDGPDNGTNSPRRYQYCQDFASMQTAHIRLNARKQIDGVNYMGEVANALTPVPLTLPFPVAGRRLPHAIVSGQTRPWGRQNNALRRDSILIEWQPRIVEPSGGNEIMRGGNGILKLENVVIDGTRIDGGLIHSTGGATPPVRNDPDIQLPQFRVRGLNPPSPANTVINALVEDYFNRYNTVPRITLLPLACWQETIRRILVHEAGQQFEYRGAARRRYAGVYYGHEQDMPIFGPPHGYGYGQHDNPRVTDDGAWSFLENIRESVRRVMEDKATLAYNHISAHIPTPVDQRTRAVYQREIVRRYNGGSEFQWDNIAADWKISPTTAQWANPRDHTQGANPLLSYPNHVLGTNIIYFTGAGAATTFPWPIDFTPADYGPET